MDPPVYRYEALRSSDSIRALVLKPSPNYDSALKCEIIQYTRLESSTSLDSDRHHEAVSYAWGEPNLSHHILCESENGSAQLKITANVDTMLRHLRKGTTSRYLWIDAICLNQTDDDEKSEQIPMIGTIYKMAKKVHVWLGCDEGDAKGVFAFFRSLCAVSDSKVESETAHRLADSTLGDHPLKKLESFLRLPWFGRRWILQEITFSKHAVVHYGPETLPWMSLMSGMRMLVAALPNDHSITDASHRVLEKFPNLSVKEKSIFELLWNFHDSHCSDPRDRIAALIGLSNAGESDELKLDYQAHWTKTFKNFASALLLQEGWQGLLPHIFAFGSLNMRFKDIPSWVPDWTGSRQNLRFIPTKISSFCWTSCSNPRMIRRRLSIGYISVSYCYDYGTITALLAKREQTDTCQDLFQFIQGQKEMEIYRPLCMEYYRNLLRLENQVCGLERFFSIIVAGETYNEDQLFEGVHRLLHSTLKEGSLCLNNEEETSEIIHKTLKSYKLFVTDQKAMAFVPSGIQNVETARMVTFEKVDWKDKASNDLQVAFVVGDVGRVPKSAMEDFEMENAPLFGCIRGRLLGPCFYTSPMIRHVRGVHEVFTLY